MKTETKLKIIINILCLLLGMTSTALYLSIKQIKNIEATIKIANEAASSWRDEAYRLGYGEWHGVEADSADSGPYIIRSNQIKDAAIVKPKYQSQEETSQPPQ